MKKDADGFILIYEDGDPMRINLIASVLEDAGIDCMVKNAGVQNLFSLGSLGGINPLIGVMKIYIRPEDYDEAKRVLDESSDLPPETQPVPEQMPPEYPSSTQGEGFLSKLRRWILGR